MQSHFHYRVDENTRADGWSPCELEHTKLWIDILAEDYIEACEYCGEPKEFEHYIECSHTFIRQLDRYLQSRALPQHTD